MKKTAAPRPRAQTPMPTTVNNNTTNYGTINNITNYFQRCQPVEAAAATTAEPEEKTRPQANEEEATEQRESKKQKTSDEPKKEKLMTSFFSRAEGPTCAEDDDPRPPHLFPQDERKHTFEKIYSGKKVEFPESQVTRDGELRAGCKNNNCSRNWLLMSDFEPRDCNNNARKKVRFQQAMQAFKEAYQRRDLEEAREARAIVEETRSGLCSKCRLDFGRLSPKGAECKTWWDELRKEKCAEQDGCANPDCPVRGPEMWFVLEGDHTHGKRAEDESKRKVERLSNYKWWSGNGGVPAMEAELAKGMRFICRCCHALDELSDQSNRYEDPTIMPNGKSTGTEEEIRQYERKRKAKIVYPKLQHVDARKRQIGCCANCRRRVPDGKGIVAFDFDHRDESTKRIGKGTLAGENGGVAGIVNNHRKDAALDAPGVEEALDEEMDKCNLLCRNCHHVKTHYRDMMDTMKRAATTAAEPEEKTRPQANEEEATEQRESKKQKLMTSFFSRAEGPTRAEDDDPRPPHLFPRDERKHTFEKTNTRGKKVVFRESDVTRDGELRAGCKNSACPRDWLPMSDFEPRDCNMNARKRVRFQQAMQAFKEAYDRRDLDAAREARAIVEETRSAKCSKCSKDFGYLSPNQQACKTWWDELRKEKCAEQDGCANPDCPVRGTEMWFVLEGDHTHGKRDEDESKRKVEKLSDYAWWSWNGGVPAMEAELAKGMRFICRCCHSVDDLSCMSNRYDDPATMPDGKRSGTEEEIRQYYRKCKAKIVYPKQQHVDNRKRQIGCCANCRRRVPDGKGVVAFDFDHRDESTKIKGKGTLAGEKGGVAGIVNNPRKDAALDAPGVEEELDEEMEKCNLLCKNCHHVKTWYRDMMDTMKRATAVQQQ